MSNDLTDNLPDDGSRSTNPMLERIVEELRALRDETRGMREELQGVRTELRGELQGVRAELRGELQSVRTELREGLQSVRAETNGLRQAIEDLGIHVDRMVAETRSGFRHEISAEVDLINSRLDRLEADVRTLRDGQS